jgi:hypothetical protein
MAARSELTYRATTPRLATRCPVCKGSLIQRIPKPSYAVSISFHCLFCKHIWKVHIEDPYTSAIGKIAGEVFVVTKRKVKHKLAAVTVAAIPGESLRKHLKSRTLQRALDAEKVDREIDALTAALETAQADDERLWQILKRDENNSQNASAWSVAYEKVKSLTQRIEGLELQRQRLASEDYFFEGLPGAASTATTDADGKFTLEIPRHGQFALVARASRQLLKGKEAYAWLVWVDLDGEPSKHLNLSNSNMLPR